MHAFNYYNEYDEFAAQWLRNLIAAGLIAPGYVDERSIEDVLPDDLHGFNQCHFFAGIGVWSYALRRAGWADDRPIWTASCPCQPFSAAGKGEGFFDERHLWPALENLIRERRPTAVLGEQVASKAAGDWIDLVCADVEALGYGVGAVPFPAASVGAPHIRDRLYWVAYAADQRLHGWGSGSASYGRDTARVESERLRDALGLANTQLDGRRREAQPTDHLGAQADRSADQHGGYCSASGELDQRTRPGPANGFWGTADWIFCRDDKWRPVEPGTQPLVTGAASRVGRLRAYGNALCAEAAVAFIEVAMEVMP